MSERDDLARRFGAIACEAGAAIMAVYGSDFTALAKADGSPVTRADQEGEAIILERLRDVLPAIPVISEEADPDLPVPDIGAGQFVLVDPLDGTKEFVSRNGEFTVNIALVTGGRAAVGAVYAPARGLLYLGGDRAWRVEVVAGATPGHGRPIATRPYPAQGLTAAVSRSHGNAETERFLARLPIAHRSASGSSLKFCRIAEGAVDVYPRFGPTMEWDTAAGHAVLAAAGGLVVTPEGEPHLYGGKAAGFRQHAFVAWGRHPLEASAAAPAGA